VADERFPSLQALWEYCQKVKEDSIDRWHPPSAIGIEPTPEGIRFTAGNDGLFLMNDWSLFALVVERRSASREKAWQGFDVRRGHGILALAVESRSASRRVVTAWKSVNGIGGECGESPPIRCSQIRLSESITPAESAASMPVPVAPPTRQWQTWFPLPDPFQAIPVAICFSSR
jgi:hypothetical protein